MKMNDNGGGQPQAVSGSPGSVMRREYETAGAGQRLWLKIESLVNMLTTPAFNPFYYLGAICVFFLWIILV
ncbi:MAG: hypothetical protein HYV23_08105, partial [Deltaproteobacteria bacterium]|nr:hypothetical protein [Deltaproteobacteria bacterium]